MFRKTLRKAKACYRSSVLEVAYRSLKCPANTTNAVSSDSVLILPAADGWEGEGPHGFGDEMLMLGLLEGLKTRFAGNMTAIRMEARGDSRIVFHGHDLNMVDFRDGWLARSSYGEFAKIASSYSHFAVVGADVLDGAYGTFNSIQRLRFLNIASRMGLGTAISGCSFNGTSDSQIRALLETAEERGTAIHARDVVSFERFGTFLRKVRSVADLAFSVDTEKYPVADRVGAIRNRAADWKSNRGIVVGVNLCGWHIKDKNRFFEDFIAALLKLEHKDRIGLILLPHDTRTDRWSDLDTLQEFSDRLQNRLEILGAPHEICSGIDAKQAVHCCDALLTGRMHLAIAAHDQGIPAVSFGYQGKFEGFYNLYDMGTQWLVDYEKPDSAVQSLASALELREELSAEIRKRMGEIRLSARRNFAWIEG